MKITNEVKVAEEVAIEELKVFAEYHLEKTINDEKLNEDYPDVLEAIKLGLLTFDDEQVPTYTLKKSIMTDNGSLALDKITFVTRIRSSEKEKLAKGIDLKNDSFKLINKLKAHLTGQPVAMLDKFPSKFDERVIDQLSSVFM